MSLFTRRARNKSEMLLILRSFNFFFWPFALNQNVLSLQRQKNKTYTSIVKEKNVHQRHEIVKGRSKVFESNDHLITHKTESSLLEKAIKITKTVQTNNHV